MALLGILKTIPLHRVGVHLSYILCVVVIVNSSLHIPCGLLCYSGE